MPATLLAAYQGLHRLADEQLVALENEDLEAIWRLSDERDAAFSALQALEPQAKALPPADRQIITGLIPAILTADERIASHLDRLQAATRQELTQLNTGMNALQSYVAGGGPEAYFIDRSS